MRREASQSWLLWYLVIDRSFAPNRLSRAVRVSPQDLTPLLLNGSMLQKLVIQPGTFLSVFPCPYCARQGALVVKIIPDDTSLVKKWFKSQLKTYFFRQFLE